MLDKILSFIAEQITAIKLKLGQDWIIEHGAHERWIYRKWANGDAECWTQYCYTERGWTPDGQLMGGYLIRKNIAFPPNLFKPGSEPTVVVDGFVGSTVSWMSARSPESHQCTVYACSPQDSLDVNCFRLIAKGRWK